MSAVVLQAEGLRKRFGATVALEGAGITLRAGEIHALMGQNGAGKSTLIKLLTGVETPDAGIVRIDGQAIAPRTPYEAQCAGISTVYQEVNLCPNLSVAENLFAGRYPRNWTGLIDHKQVHEGAHALLAQLQLQLDVARPLGSYPVAIQQMVAIARALGVSARVLILDEPTSSLDQHEVRELFALMRRLRERGMAILFVTHFLDQVYAVSDRITVLRNGALVGEYATSQLTQAQLVTAMVGRELGPASTPVSRQTRTGAAPPVVEARGLGRRGALHPVDLEVRAGEVLGLGGLLGSGRTELARLLFGLDRADCGQLQVDGDTVDLRHPADAVACGFALCPEERKTEGIIAGLSVRENIVLALQARGGWWSAVTRERQQVLASELVQRLGIKVGDIESPLGALSGGNQQKVVLARWLATAPRLLILDEPTRGIDVAARQEIMDQILLLAGQGMAVLFISAEIEELTRLCDRLVVLRERRVAGELPAGSDAQQVLALIAGEA
jgi:simple sugar transport system ATP-binding protein